ncbi:transcriptional regulator [Photobacterium swingsii]|uniref:winged helix-turn-helix domain-containing protein n=1 Tax=Photobacterium swingsii TaxID=680026 RepID=UPI00352DEB79
MNALKVFNESKLIFTFDFKKHLLRGCNGFIINLSSSEFTCLVLLLSNKQSISYRKYLERKIWPCNPSAVDIDKSNNLTQVICTLRRKLSYFTEEEIIVTEQLKGYRLNNGIHTVLFNIDYIKKKINIKKNTFTLLTIILFALVISFNISLHLK